jgi:hypothetical protein
MLEKVCQTSLVSCWFANGFLQISSLWSSSPVKDDKPYDPTNPKMNPLNPEGLRPYVICAKIGLVTLLTTLLPVVVRVQRPSPRVMTAF